MNREVGMSMRGSGLTLLMMSALLAGASSRAAPPPDAPIALRLDELEVVNRTVSQRGDEIHLDAAVGAGFGGIKGLDINEGCLSVEVRGTHEVGKSFVGLAFRGL